MDKLEIELEPAVRGALGAPFLGVYNGQVSVLTLQWLVCTNK